MKRIALILILVLLSLGLGTAVLANKPDRFLDVIVVLDVGPDVPGQIGRDIAAAVANENGVHAIHTYGNVFSGFAARVPEAVYQRLRNDPLVAFIDYDGPVSIAGGPPGSGGGGGGSTGQTTPWGISRVGAPVSGNSGAGIDIYILDTGIDPNHRDLNVLGGFAVERCRGGSCGGQDWGDNNGHGTHVAGTAAALNNDVDVVGVAPGANLWAVKVLSGSGSGSRSGVIAGVDWVAGHRSGRNGPAVANMSLGGSGSKTGTCTSSGFSGSDAYHAAICNATRQGVVFVVAAGNSGANAAGAVPAAFDDTVITVSATNVNDDWTSWSNWGNQSAGWTSNNSAPVAIAAPGAAILSTRAGGGTESLSGTSMASPHVAGAAALVLASTNQQKNFSAFTNVRANLLQSAESTSNFSNTSGNPHAEDFLDVR